MTTVNALERAIVRARHQRRPRLGASSAVIRELTTAIQGPGTSIPEPRPEDAPLALVLDYPAPGDTVDFLFWSMTDGVTGRVDSLDPQNFDNYVSANSPMTATAWYSPPANGNGMPPGPPDLMLDAFSTVTGDFIDDDFVEVVSAPELTEQANVGGWVPTEVAVTLEAIDTIDEVLSFDRWILLDAGSPSREDPRQLDVPASAGGIAIAVYTANDVTHRPPPQNFDRWLRIVLDIAAVGGLLLTRGGGDGTDELERRLSAGAAIGSLAGNLGPDAALQVEAALVQDRAAAIKAAAARLPTIGK
jgi:hypothetical protein